MWLLRELSLPYLLRHKARSVLTLLGATLGVAAMVATTTVTDAVFQSFRTSVEATAGAAELQLTNGGAGVPEALLEQAAQVPGVASAAALVEGFVTLADGSETVAIFGFDLLADDQHRAQLPRSALEIPDEVLFVSQVDSVVLARDYAARRGYALDRPLEVWAPAGTRRLVVRGLVDSTGPAALFGGAVALMDLPAAQRLLAKDGRVDRIDVQLTNAALRDDVHRHLDGVSAGRARVEDRAVHGAKAEDLLFSLRVTLALAGLVAAMVGFFIIYHTVTVSLVQRRRQIAVVAALGVGPWAIVGWLAAEAAVLGVVATAGGLLAGLSLARVSVATFGSVATAWVQLPVGRAELTASAWALATAVGLGTTLAATLVPVWAIVTQPSGHLLHLGAQGRPRRTRVWQAAGGAGLCLGLTVLLVGLAPRTLPYLPLVTLIFTMTFLALMTFALLSPAAAVVCGRAAEWCAERLRGLSLLLAGGSLARNPGGPVAVVAAIVMGLGWSLSNASLIASFKQSWLGWIDAHYQSDLLVTGGGATVAFLTGPPIADQVVEELRALPGVRDVQGVRMVESHYGGRPATVEAIDASAHGLPLEDGAWTAVADAFWNGRGAAVSDHLAHRTGLQRGDTLTLSTPSGALTLPVLGIFTDFQSGDLGSIAISRDLYRRAWGDAVVNTIRVWTDPTATDQVRTAIQHRFGQSHGLRVLTTAEFRAAVADLVENALSITYGLLLIALAVSLVGVANFLLAAAIDREPQRRVLTAVGASPAQLGAATVLEGTLVGVVGVLLGLAAGFVESRLIVDYCVPMVCGWRFQYHFPAMTAALLGAMALMLSGGAGLLAMRFAAAQTAARAGWRE